MKQRIAEQQEASRNYYFVKTLSLEMTRRCNMKCRFCARGDAQKLDMSREIIDKVLDEIKGFDLYNLRLNGGEPLLAKDGIIYLVNEIIRRGVRLCGVHIFTNATVKDDDIKSALLKLGAYCKKLCQTPWGKRMNEIFQKKGLRSVYDNDAYISIIASTTLHDNSDTIDQTIDFYCADPELLWAVNQDTSKKGHDGTIHINKSPYDTHIVLRGNAKRNFKSLYDEGFKHFSLHENNFDLFSDLSIYDNYIVFNKSITVSATGRVFPGCLMPYEEVDAGTDIIVNNILDCNGNLFDYLSDYSWKNPLNEKQSHNLDVWKTILLYYENGIKDCWLNSVPLNEDAIELAGANIKVMKIFEEGLRELHRLYPTTVHNELNVIGAVKYAYSHKDMKIREHILTNICGYKVGEDGILPDYSDETLENLLDKWDKVYYKRKYELYGDTSPSAALVEKATTDVLGTFLSGLLAGFGKQLLKK